MTYQIEVPIDVDDWSGALMRCPSCEGTATHVDEVGVTNASNQVARVSAYGEDERAELSLSLHRERRNSYSGRRHTITLTMCCEECPAITRIDLRQHKGGTFVRAVVHRQ